MIFVHLLADLKNIFFKNCFKILDYHDDLISSYQISVSFAEKNERLWNKVDRQFCIKSKRRYQGKYHWNKGKRVSTCNINLNFTHKPSHKATTSKLDAIHQLKEKLKESMIKNMVENVVDQNQAGTIVEFASAFDMCRPIDLDACIKYIKKLHTLYMGQIIFMKFQKLLTIGKITAYVCYIRESWIALRKR